ncbi:MAG TPA: hypothetical protein VH540_00550 [Ktedonobacterales bacterium]|jgi:hypothetical protein
MTRENSSLHNVPQAEELAPETEVPEELALETEVPIEDHIEHHHWEPEQEEEWEEHAATAWTLAHIIHRVYATPLPPALSPEQRHHFQKIIKMAAALIEAWQQREREQAQQMAAERPSPVFEDEKEEEVMKTPVAPEPAHQRARQ